MKTIEKYFYHKNYENDPETTVETEVMMMALSGCVFSL